MEVNEIELQRFLISHGFIDGFEQTISLVDRTPEGIEVSDQYDRVYYIQKIEESYFIYGRGRFDRFCCLIC